MMNTINHYLMMNIDNQHWIMKIINQMMTGFKITAVITTRVCFEYISELFRILMKMLDLTIAQS